MPHFWSKAENKSRRLSISHSACLQKQHVHWQSASPLQVVDKKSFDIAPSNSVKPWATQEFITPCQSSMLPLSVSCSRWLCFLARPTWSHAIPATPGVEHFKK